MNYLLPPLPTVYPKCTGNRNNYIHCDGSLIPLYIIVEGEFKGFAWKCEGCGKEVRV